MANLYLTHKCNRGCAFCFARKVLSESGADVNELLSISDIEKLIEHFRGQLPELGILGGEPFLYPYFGELMELLKKNMIIPKIFTSATDPMPKYLEEMDFRTSPVGFIVNVNVRESYSDAKYENLMKFFDKFHAVASLSYTILDLDADVSFLFDLIIKHNLARSIRTGVALPIYKGGNKFVERDDYKRFGDFYEKFARRAASEQVVLGMDCGFTPCMFTPKQVGALQRCGVIMAFCCGAALDIGPGLQSWNCFPLFRLHRENILNYDTVEHAKRAFEAKMDSYFDKVGIFDDCDSCKYFKNGFCNGGCKSYKSL